MDRLLTLPCLITREHQERKASAWFFSVGTGTFQVDVCNTKKRDAQDDGALTFRDVSGFILLELVGIVRYHELSQIWHSIMINYTLVELVTF